MNSLNQDLKLDKKYVFNSLQRFGEKIQSKLKPQPSLEKDSTSIDQSMPTIDFTLNVCYQSNKYHCNNCSYSINSLHLFGQHLWYDIHQDRYGSDLHCPHKLVAVNETECNRMNECPIVCSILQSLKYIKLFEMNSKNIDTPQVDCANNNLPNDANSSELSSQFELSENTMSSNCLKTEHLNKISNSLNNNTLLSSSLNKEYSTTILELFVDDVSKDIEYLSSDNFNEHELNDNQVHTDKKTITHIMENQNILTPIYKKPLKSCLSNKLCSSSLIDHTSNKKSQNKSIRNTIRSVKFSSDLVKICQLQNSPISKINKKKFKSNDKNKLKVTLKFKKTDYNNTKLSHSLRKIREIERDISLLNNDKKINDKKLTSTETETNITSEHTPNIILNGDRNYNDQFDNTCHFKSNKEPTELKLNNYILENVQTEQNNSTTNVNDIHNSSNLSKFIKEVNSLVGSQSNDVPISKQNDSSRLTFNYVNKNTATKINKIKDLTKYSNVHRTKNIINMTNSDKTKIGTTKKKYVDDFNKKLSEISEPSLQNKYIKKEKFSRNFISECSSPVKENWVCNNLKLPNSPFKCRYCNFVHLNRRIYLHHLLVMHSQENKVAIAKKKINSPINDISNESMNDKTLLIRDTKTDSNNFENSISSIDKAHTNRYNSLKENKIIKTIASKNKLDAEKKENLFKIMQSIPATNIFTKEIACPVNGCYYATRIRFHFIHHIKGHSKKKKVPTATLR